ncbi:MAG: hypothetical protein IKI57_03990 [Clostridia bacterium]|nr:hypothetical protein [Clostridia bacterium]
MKNNKGISIITVVVTIIVIIILASIGISNSLVTVDNTAKAVFQEDFKNYVQQIKTYNLEAILRQQVDDYDPDELNWDGKSEYLENSARIENKDQEDTIEFLLKGYYTKSLDDKVYIENGELKVRDKYLTEQAWADELHLYKRSGD